MIFDSNIDWAQLARYLSDESTPEEKAIIEARLSSDDAFREVYEQADHVWRATNKPAEGIDRTRAWRIVHEKIRQNERDREALRLVQNDRRKEDRRARRPENTLRPTSWSYVLLAFVVLFGGIFLLERNASSPPEHAETPVFRTTAGQRASITLPDGSQAILNAKSRLQILSDTGDAERLVEVDGEAFFSVERDPARPFIVRIGEAEVRVLGTSFNVSAYPEQSEVQVAVTEGEVRLQGRGHENEAVVLLANDVGRLPEDGPASRIDGVSLENLLAWKDGHLVFENTRFDQVALTLERWFNLDVVLGDARIANRHLTASFEKPVPNQVVAIIARTLELEYSIEDSTVTFSSPRRR